MPLKRQTRTPNVVDCVLQHDSRSIPYRLYLQRRRSLRIAVTPQLVVNVFAPVGASKKQLGEAIRKRAPWIIKTLDRVASCKILSLPERFVTGAPIPYLGHELRLSMQQGNRKSAELLFDRLIVTVPDPRDQNLAARWVDRWYRDRASEIFTAQIHQCLQVAALKDVPKPTLTVRKMRSRWGSCSSTGRVTLNLKLLMVPEPCIEYVVMHELCHMIHHNHSKQYYALLTACMPEWKDRKRKLDGYRLE